MITLYNVSGKVYQTIIPTENDIIYNDLIKYIKIPKHQEFDEIDFNNKIYNNKVSVKTSIMLFYNCDSCNEIKLDDEINKNELFIMFNHKYYINRRELKNDIKNYDDKNDFIKSNPYKLIFIDPQIENYQEICKLAVQQNGCVLEFVKEQTEKICKLAVQQNGYALRYVPPELMNEEICKIAVQQCSYAVEYVKEPFYTDEICKCAVKKNGLALKCIKKQFQTEEICKLAIEENHHSLQYVEKQTVDICKYAIQQHGCSLEYVSPELMTEELCKLAVQQNGLSLKHVKEEFKTEEICKYAKQNLYTLFFIH